MVHQTRPIPLDYICSDTDHDEYFTGDTMIIITMLVVADGPMRIMDRLRQDCSEQCTFDGDGDDNTVMAIKYKKDCC